LLGGNLFVVFALQRNAASVGGSLYSVTGVLNDGLLIALALQQRLGVRERLLRFAQRVGSVLLRAGLFGDGNGVAGLVDFQRHLWRQRHNRIAHVGHVVGVLPALE
jgi:hypothetical protein